MEESDDLPLWESVQLHAFCEWANAHLGSGEIASLTDGSLDDGLILIQLVESVTGDKLGHRVAHPKNPIQKLSNIAVALKYIHTHICERLNIRVRFAPEDILQRSRKNILGVTWVLIRYEAQKGLDGRDLWGSLIQWVHSTLKSSPQAHLYADVTSVVESATSAASSASAWSDGFIFLALIHSQDKSLFEWESALSMPPKDRLDMVFSLAEFEFGVRRLLSSDDLLDGSSVDRKTLIAYVTLLRRSFPKRALQLAVERISKWTSSMQENDGKDYGKKNDTKTKMVIGDDDDDDDDESSMTVPHSSTLPSSVQTNRDVNDVDSVIQIQDSLTDQILLADNASQQLLVMMKTLLHAMYCHFVAIRSNSTLSSSFGDGVGVVDDGDDCKPEEMYGKKECDSSIKSPPGEPLALTSSSPSASCDDDPCVVLDACERKEVNACVKSRQPDEDSASDSLATSRGSQQQQQQREEEEEGEEESEKNAQLQSSVIHEDVGNGVFACAGVDIGTQTGAVAEEEVREMVGINVGEEKVTELEGGPALSEHMDDEHVVIAAVKSWFEENEDSLKDFFVGTESRNDGSNGTAVDDFQVGFHEMDTTALLSKIFVRGMEIKRILEKELNDRPTSQQLQDVKENLSVSEEHARALQQHIDKLEFVIAGLDVSSSSSSVAVESQLTKQDGSDYRSAPFYDEKGEKDEKDVVTLKTTLTGSSGELSSSSALTPSCTSSHFHRPPSNAHFADAGEELDWYKSHYDEQAEEISRLLVLSGIATRSPSHVDEKDIVIGEFARARLQWEHEREDIHEALEKVKKDLREKSLQVDRLSDKVAKLQSDNEKSRKDHLSVSKTLEMTTLNLKKATEELDIARESLEEKSQELRTCQETRKIASITIRKLKAELRECGK